MKQILISFLLLLLSLPSWSQDDLFEKAKAIEAEGKHLFRLEKASWHGTDLFLEQYKNTKNIGGYVSYIEDDVAKCVFISRADTPIVIGTITFDKDYNLKKSKVDLAQRPISQIEMTLLTMRMSAGNVIQNDTLFKTYSNTSYNLIPLIYGGEKKVYILTAPQKSGVMILGNDYLIRFSDDLSVKDYRALHQNIIPIFYDSEELKGKEVDGSVHSHLPATGEFITPTDICTLMLYSKYAGWKQHTVVSENHISIWNCENNSLLILTKNALEEISKDQDKRKKKKKKKRRWRKNKE